MSVFSRSSRQRKLGRSPALALTLGCAIWMAACGAEFDLDKADKILAAETQGRFFRLQVFDQDVTCTPWGFFCYEGQSLATPESLAGIAEVEASLAYPSSGLRVRLPVRRAKTVGDLLIDMPVTAAGADASKMIFTYEERDAQGELSFAGDTAQGIVELPAPGCACADIRFEFRFGDAGPDGKLGTADDRTRRINAGLLNGATAACESTMTLPLGDRATILERSCAGSGAGAGSGGGGGGTGTGTGTGAGHGGSGHSGQSGAYDTTPVVVSEGCAESFNAADGCASSEEGCDDSDGACNGDQGCEGDSSASGCEGDSSSDSGCGGDESSGGCDGDDSDPACAIGLIKRWRIHNGFMMSVLLMLLVTRSMWRRGRRRLRRWRRRRS